MTRAGGYTRIMKTRHRLSDNAPMVLMEWTEKRTVQEIIPPTEAKKETKKAEKAPKKEVKAAKSTPAKKVVEKKTEKKEKTK